MARKNKRSHHENQDITNIAINPLSTIGLNAPGIPRVPQGIIPFMTLPHLDTEDNMNNPDKAEDEERLP